MTPLMNLAMPTCDLAATFEPLRIASRHFEHDARGALLCTTSSGSRAPVAVFGAHAGHVKMKSSLLFVWVRQTARTP